MGSDDPFLTSPPDLVARVSAEVGDEWVDAGRSAELESPTPEQGAEFFAEVRRRLPDPHVPGLTVEQREFLEEVGPVRPSGTQTPAQAMNLAADGFRAACMLAGFEPLPADGDVRAAIVALGLEPSR